MGKLNYERIPARVWAKQWFKDGDDDRVVFAKSLGGQSWLSNQWCANTPNGYQVVQPGYWLVMDPELVVMCDEEFKSKYRPAQELGLPFGSVD